MRNMNSLNILDTGLNSSTFLDTSSSVAYCTPDTPSLLFWKSFSTFTTNPISITKVLYSIPLTSTLKSKQTPPLLPFQTLCMPNMTQSPWWNRKQKGKCSTLVMQMFCSINQKVPSQKAHLPLLPSKALVMQIGLLLINISRTTLVNWPIARTGDINNKTMIGLGHGWNSRGRAGGSRGFKRNKEIQPRTSSIIIQLYKLTLRTTIRWIRWLDKSFTQPFSQIITILISTNSNRRMERWLCSNTTKSTTHNNNNNTTIHNNNNPPVSFFQMKGSLINPKHLIYRMNKKNTQIQMLNLK